MRSSQVLSSRIDDEYVHLIESKIRTVVAQLDPNLSAYLSLEINLCCCLCYYLIPLLASFPTAGMKCCQLKFNEDIKIMKLAAVIVINYIFQRFESQAISIDTSILDGELKINLKKNFLYSTLGLNSRVCIWYW
jgi:hypothetical protein